MSKIMLINVTHAEESRVGIVDDGQLESFEIESFSREHLKGNIYKGVVRRIHPGDGSVRQGIADFLSPVGQRLCRAERGRQLLRDAAVAWRPVLRTRAGRPVAR